MTATIEIRFGNILLTTKTVCLPNSGGTEARERIIRQEVQELKEGLKAYVRYKSRINEIDK